MNQNVSKKTQEMLGKLIKKPPLTDKLLSKPPFRFLHDIVTSVIKTTGFMKGLFTDVEMNSENVKEKDAKMAFLQKAIDIAVAVTGRSLTVRPARVVAGHEPENTNEWLQTVALAINAKVDNEMYVRKVLSMSGGSSVKEEKRDKEQKQRVAENNATDNALTPDDKERVSDLTSGSDKSRRTSKDTVSRGDGRHGGELKGSHSRRKHHQSGPEDRGRERRERDRRGDGQRGEAEKPAKSEEQVFVRQESHDGRREAGGNKESALGQREYSRRDSTGERDGSCNVEQGNHREEGGEVNQDVHEVETQPRLRRPASAKGFRRKRQDGGDAIRQDAEVHVPPQVVAGLGSGPPSNVIVDDDKRSAEDDESFLMEDPANLSNSHEMVRHQSEQEDTVHGTLVKKMLESKEQAERQASAATKTQIERPSLPDAQRRRQRDSVAKEIDQLQTSVQSLTRAVNPLGKMMDYVQEDLDAMQKELQKWRLENREHIQTLRRGRSVTDQAVEPLKARLADIDRDISDQFGLIAACKSKIYTNDSRIQKILQSVARSS